MKQYFCFLKNNFLSSNKSQKIPLNNDAMKCVFYVFCRRLLTAVFCHFCCHFQSLWTTRIVFDWMFYVKSFWFKWRTSDFVDRWNATACYEPMLWYRCINETFQQLTLLRNTKDTNENFSSLFVLSANFQDFVFTSTSLLQYSQSKITLFLLFNYNLL